MARNIEDVNREYSIACSELGQAVYRKSVLEEEVEKFSYQIEKLQNKCKSLNQEGTKLMEMSNEQKQSDSDQSST